MKFWETILISLILIIVMPILCSAFWFFKVREEKKFSVEGSIRTRPPKIVSGFFLGVALLFLCGGTAGILYCCVTDSENTTVSIVIILAVCVAAFSALAFFGYANIRFNYVVADAEGILACRLFRKKRYYRYEEIEYIHDSTSLGMMGGLIGYDKENKKIFAVDAIHIGAADVAQRLREHGVRQSNPTYSR